MWLEGLRGRVRLRRIGRERMGGGVEDWEGVMQGRMEVDGA